MDKSECAGVESLARADFKAIVYKGFVFCRRHTSEDLVASVACVIEQRMTYMAHMDAYLMCASGLKDATDKSDMGKSLDGLIVSDGVFAHISVRKYGHLQSVAQ